MDDNFDFDHDAYAAIRSGIARPSALSRPSTLSSPSAMGVGMGPLNFGEIDVDTLSKPGSAPNTTSSAKPPPTGPISDWRLTATSPNTAYQTPNTTSSAKPPPTGPISDGRSTATSPNTAYQTPNSAIQTNLQQAKQGIGTAADTQQARQEVTKTTVSEPVVGTGGGTSAPAPVISIVPTWGGPAPYPPDPPPPTAPDFALVEARTLADPRKVELLLETPSGCYSFIYRIPESTPLPEDVLASLNDVTAETMVRSLFSGDSTPFKVSELLGLLTESGRARLVDGCELPEAEPAGPQTRSMSLLPLLAIAGIGLLVTRYAQ